MFLSLCFLAYMRNCIYTLSDRSTPSTVGFGVTAVNFNRDALIIELSWQPYAFGSSITQSTCLITAYPQYFFYFCSTVNVMLLFLVSYLSSSQSHIYALFIVSFPSIMSRKSAMSSRWEVAVCQRLPNGDWSGSAQILTHEL